MRITTIPISLLAAGSILGGNLALATESTRTTLDSNSRSNHNHLNLRYNEIYVFVNF